MATQKIDATQVAKLRADNVGWQKIADDLGDGSTAFGIRCREALYRLQVANGDITTIKPTPAQVRAARERGEGWSLIAIRAGISVAAAKKLAAKKEGANPLSGRNYRRADGTVNHSEGAAIVHAAKLAEAMEDVTPVEEAPAAEVKKPRRPRRTRRSQAA